MSNTTKVGIDNVPFAIQRIIEDCPYTAMTVREIIKNAIEATVAYKSKNNISKPVYIDVRGLKVPELTGYDTTGYKFSVLNYGGMSQSQLNKSCKLFSSVNKTQSLDNNFGVGLKINLGNFTDWLVISYKNKQAHYVYLGMEGNSLCILNDIQANNCTEWVQEYAEVRGYDLEHEWTEVIVLGKNNPGLNTIEHFFGPNRDTTNRFFTQSVLNRFVDIPKDVVIRFVKGESSRATPHSGHSTGNCLFKPWETSFEMSKKPFPDCRSESVVAEDGVTYHWYYDPLTDKGTCATDGRNNILGNADFCSLIWGKHEERERYDVRDIGKWKRIASQLGVYADHKCFKVFVELPYADYITTTYRDRLKGKGDSDKNDVTMTDFLQGMKATMPEWLKEKVREHNASANPSSIDDKIEEYFKDNFQGEPTPGGDKQGESSTKQQNPKSSTQKKSKKTKITSSRPTPKVFAPVQFSKPKFIESQEPYEYCQYVPDGNGGTEDVVYYNPTHPLVDTLFEKIAEKFDENIHSEIKKETIDWINAKIGGWIIFTKGQVRGKSITQETFDQMTLEQPLTLFAKQNAELEPRIINFAKQKQKEFEMGV